MANGNQSSYQSPIYDFMQELGFYGQDPTQYSGGDIMGRMQSYFDIGDPTLLKPGMFDPISYQSWAATKPGYYQPLAEQQTGSFMKQLLGQTRAIKGPGIAGSGDYDRMLAGLTDEYGQSMTGLFSGISEQQQLAKSNVYEQMQDWFTTGQDIRYG